MLGEWALSIVGVEEGREFRFRGDLYSQESTFPLVISAAPGCTKDVTAPEHAVLMGIGAYSWWEVKRLCAGWNC